MKIMSKMLSALKKATPVYLAILVICGVLANAGATLPSPMRWAYEPVEKTTAYASSIIEEFEQAQVPQETLPAELVVESGVFWNTFTTADGQELSYVIRTPENITMNMPLVVYLHEEGITNIPNLAHVGPVKAAETTNANNCIVVQPLTDASWVVESKEAIVREFTQYIVDLYYCDETRVTLTGFGDGATAVWYYAALHPEFWTHISPVSAAPKTDIDPLIGKNIDCYMVFGEYDVYSIKGEMNRVGKTLQENGATVFQIVVEQADHSVVRTQAYDNNWFTWACQ